MEHVYCGYIKAKFPLVPGKPLADHESYIWANDVARPRTTSHFIYIVLGHDDIVDNAHARRIITTIKEIGGKLTRLDFNIDYLGTLDFDAFYSLHDNDIAPVPQEVKTPGSKTVYVGKRSSARMLRVYDKRGEIKAKKGIDIGFELTRIEIEIKRTMIARYLRMFMSGNTLGILNDIQELYGLRGFCSRHERSKPCDVTNKKTSVFGFIYRFRRIIRQALLLDVCEFLDIIGVTRDDIMQFDK